MKKLILSIFFVTLGVIVFPTKANAATYTVTKTADTLDGTCDADCSFSEAVAAANANSGADEIDFNIPPSDGGYVPASGSTQAYWLITQTNAITLSDDSGVFINGYSQTGSSRNTASFGDTINAVITIQVFFNINGLSMNITGNNNHVAGLDIRTLLTQTNIINLDTSSNNWIEGNFFGSDITGFSASNGGSFSLLNNSSSNTFGTNGDGSGDASERNLFAGFAGGPTGIGGYISVGSGGGDGSVIAGNYFGTDITGRACTAKVLTNGVMQLSTANNRIGTNYDSTSDSEESNIIGCTTVNGSERGFMRVLGPATNNLVQGNYVGVSSHGDNLGSLTGTGRGAITMNSGVTTGNVIKGNTITNGDYGIRAAITGSINNTFSHNIIYGNSVKDIDLTNTTTSLLNDTGDLDTGANGLMNYPVITKAEYLYGGTYHIYGNLDGNALEAPYTIEVCKSSENSIGYGGCRLSLGTMTLAAPGDWDMTVTVPGDDDSHHSSFSALATNVNGSTSEFSQTAATYATPVVVSMPTPAINVSGQGGVTSQNNVVSVVPAGTFKYDAYFTAEPVVQTKAFKLPNTNYWQISPTYNLWWKAFGNDAKILSSELKKPFIVSLPYSVSSYGPNLSLNNLKLAFSTDGKRWKIITNVVINKQNKTIATVTKNGGYYMVVAGSGNINLPVLGKKTEIIATPEVMPTPTVEVVIPTLSPTPTSEPKHCFLFWCK